MRRIACLIVLLAGLGWAAVELPSASSPAESSPEPAWRRTRDGWQRKEQVLLQTPGAQPPLHPLTVALFELLAACWALGTFGKK